MPAKSFNAENAPIPAAAVVAGLAVFFGIDVFSFGFWLAWPPLGFITGGLSLAALGVLLGRRTSARRRP
jgi:uncharacterized membrane protein YiaA